MKRDKETEEAHNPPLHWLKETERARISSFNTVLKEVPRLPEVPVKSARRHIRSVCTCPVPDIH